MAEQDDVLRILVATDNHVGYLERDPMRKDDSFDTLDEIMSIALEKKADFVLFGGDLFHENKPSRYCVFRVMESLRRQVYGDREILFEVVSDQKTNFSGPAKQQSVNYENPNVNIQLPVFIIHGNHDDPVGEQGLGALDILCSANLINYFGRSEKVDDVQLYPLCIQKGSTKLAMYGLGHIRDQRLHRTFESGRVTFLRPDVDTEHWFNLGIVHQNRHHHAHKDYLDENFLDEMLDICIWGHEHECLIGGGMHSLPQTNHDIIIMQPGSSVATSLVSGEAKEKNIALLEVKQQKWKMTPIRLNTVRPMFVHDVKLSDIHAHLESTSPADVARHLEEWVDKMIDECRQILEDRGVDLTDPIYAKLLFPLIRFNVECGKHPSPFHPQQFGQRFVGKIANPNDIVVFRKGRLAEGIPRVGKADHSTGTGCGEEEPHDDILLPGMELNAADVTSYVLDILAQPNAKKLHIFTAKDLTEAISSFAIKEEKHAITDFVEQKLKEVQVLLSQDTRDLDAATSLISDTVRNEISRAVNGDPDALNSGVIEAANDSDDDTSVPVPVPATTTRGRGRGARATTATKRSRAAAVVSDDDDAYHEDNNTNNNNNSDSDKSMEIAPPPPKRARGAATATAATTTTATARGRGRGRGRGRAAQAASAALDSDPFTPPPTTTTTSSRRGKAASVISGISSSPASHVSSITTTTPFASPLPATTAATTPTRSARGARATSAASNTLAPQQQHNYPPLPTPSTSMSTSSSARGGVPLSTPPTSTPHVLSSVSGVSPTLTPSSRSHQPTLNFASTSKRPTPKIVESIDIDDDDDDNDADGGSQRSDSASVVSTPKAPATTSAIAQARGGNPSQSQGTSALPSFLMSQTSQSSSTTSKRRWGARR